MTYVGRYIKALIDSPNGGSVKAGEYGLIKKNNLSHIDFPQHRGYSDMGALTQPSKYQLMPEDYKPEEIIPKYVKCITNTFKNFTNGKIYKTKGLDSSHYLIELDDKNNSTNGLHKCHFEPSTEEAYFAQDTLDTFNPKVGDWVVYTSSSTPDIKQGTVTQITFHDTHNNILKLMTPELDKEYPTKEGWQYARNFRLALPNEILGATTGILPSFPQEGCVYYDKGIDDLHSLSKYLISRPYNRADGKTEMWEAVGIGWNHNSCWWLKTKASGKTVYKLKDIQHLYLQQTKPSVKSMKDILKLDDSHLGSIISCEWSDKYYNKCLFIKEGGYYYLLNNVTTNNDGHKDKSKYKYSLLFYNLEALNKSVKNIKLLDTYDIGVFTAQYDISTRAEMLKKYPYPASHNPCGEISLSSNDGMVSLTIPEVRKVPIKVDYSISVKLADIQLPDFSVKPKKIEVIKIEPYNIYL